MHAIASLEIINARLEEARKTMGVRADELMPQAGASRATWYSWMNGSEGGIRQVSLIAAHLGLRPDELILESPLAALPDLDGAQVAALDEIARHCSQITRMTFGKKKPAVALAQMLREVVENFEPVQEHNMPEGTVIAKPEPKVTTYEPPPKSGKTASATGEGKPKYGKRKA